MKTPDARTATVLALVLCFVFASRAMAQTPPRGQAAGTAFTLDCGPDRALVGVNIRSDGNVIGLQAVCARVWPNGTWTGFTETPPESAGGSAGTVSSLLCDAGLAVVGIHGAADARVGRIGIHCARLVQYGVRQDGHPRVTGFARNAQDFQASVDATEVPAAGSGTAFDDTCFWSGPIVVPGRGLKGFADSQINQIQLTCGNPTPRDTPSLGNPTFSASPAEGVNANTGTRVTLSLQGAPPVLSTPWTLTTEYVADQQAVGDWPDVRTEDFAATVTGLQSQTWYPSAAGTYRLQAHMRLFHDGQEVSRLTKQSYGYKIGYQEVPVTLRTEIWPGQMGREGLWLVGSLPPGPVNAPIGYFKYEIKTQDGVKVWTNGAFDTDLGWGVPSLQPGVYTLTTWGERLTTDPEPRIEAVGKLMVSPFIIVAYPSEGTAAFTAALEVTPSPRARSDSPIVLKAIESGTPPPLGRKSCTYAVIPSAGATRLFDSSRCDPVEIRPLAPGTYTLRLTYRYQPDASFDVMMPDYLVGPTPKVDVTSFTFAPDKPQAGQIVNVRMRISNASDGRLARIPWQIQKNGTVLRSGARQWVGQGDTFEEVAAFIAEPGDVSLVGSVDAENELNEPQTWRADNSKSASLTVPAPPAVITGTSSSLSCKSGYAAVSTPGGPRCADSTDVSSCDTRSVDPVGFVLGIRVGFACQSNDDCAFGYVCSTSPCGGTCLREQPPF